MISVDTLGPFPRTLEGYEYILVVEDLFSKWVEAFPMRAANARTLCRLLENEIIDRYGPPRVVISDNAKIFTSGLFTHLLRRIQATSLLTPVLHQRANSVERRVQELKKILTTLLLGQRNKKLWSKYLTAALRIMRSRRNRATGMSPAQALLGYELPRCGDWGLPVYLKERRAARYDPRVRHDMIREQQRLFNRQLYEDRPLPPRRYQVGDRVMVKETRANLQEFNPRWTGPCEITDKLSDEVFVVDRDGVPTRIHIDRLRPAPRGNRDQHETSDHESDLDDASTSSSASSDPEEHADEPEEQQPAGEAPRESVPLQEATETPIDAATQPMRESEASNQRSESTVAPPNAKRRRRRARPVIQDAMPGPSGLQQRASAHVPSAYGPLDRDMCASSDSD